MPQPRAPKRMPCPRASWAGATAMAFCSSSHHGESSTPVHRRCAMTGRRCQLRSSARSVLTGDELRIDVGRTRNADAGTTPIDGIHQLGQPVVVDDGGIRRVFETRIRHAGYSNVSRRHHITCSRHLGGAREFWRIWWRVRSAREKKFAIGRRHHAQLGFGSISKLVHDIQEFEGLILRGVPSSAELPVEHPLMATSATAARATGLRLEHAAIGILILHRVSPGDVVHNPSYETGPPVSPMNR